MSSTVYWQQVTPDKPLGSDAGLKWVLFDEQARPPTQGAKAVISAMGGKATYLKGYLDALGTADDRREPLAQFLEDLRQHGELEVWVAE
jgi:hypothetical protein